MRSLIHRGLIVLMSAVIVTAIVFPKTSKVEAAGPSLDLKAPAAILVDAKNGEILYEKNADVMKEPASMSKMMTEYLVFDAIKKGQISWNTKVQISQYAYQISQNYGLSNVPLRTDVKYTVKQLFEAMEIESANGAAIALAEEVAGTESKFVQMMNAKAKQLGLKHANFVNCTGLNNSDLNGHIPAGGPHSMNKMSVRSVAKLAYALLKNHPEILQFSSIAKKKFTKGFPKNAPFQMKNWNWMIPGLIYGYKGIDGLKTGSTPQAGYSFTATAKRGNLRLISVVMDTGSYKDRFGQTKILLDYGFGHFETTKLLDKGYAPKGKKSLPVSKGKTDKVSIASNKPISMLIEKGTKKQYKPEFTINQSKLSKKGKLTAPVKKGTVVGQVKMTYTGGKSYGYLTNSNNQNVSPVVTTGSVQKASWFTLMMRGVGGFFSGIFSGAAHTVKGWFGG